MATKFYFVVGSNVDRPGFGQWVKTALNLEKVEEINSLTLIIQSDKSAEEILKILRKNVILNEVGFIGVFSLNYPFAISPERSPLAVLLSQVALAGLYRTLQLEEDPDATP
jgi:hypothetical protein